MASHQYSLRWNNYVKHVSTAFEALRCERELTDVTLSCEGKKIPAHKMLLSACSSYFKGLFKENPCQHPIIIFRNVAFDDLIALVDFMYKGEVNVEEERLSSFLNTAELLEVQGLTNSGRDVDKSRKTAEEENKTVSEEQPEVTPLPFAAFSESSQPSPSTSSNARKRRRISPVRTDEESQPKVQAVSDEPVIEPIEHLPLKTEAPEFEHIELNPDDSVDGDDLAASGLNMDGSDMDNYAMAGPSNDSMGEDKGRHFLMDPNEFVNASYSGNRLAAGADGQTKVSIIKGPNDRFECGWCRKVFSHYRTCRSHTHVHLGNTTCRTCGKTFNYRHHLNEHVKVHLAKTKCHDCGKSFSTIHNLTRHVQTAHKKSKSKK